MVSLRILLVIIVFLLPSFKSNAQLKKDNLKLGISYGVGSQNKFPFNLKDYTHTVNFYKVVINYKFFENQKWHYEVNIEPSYNQVEHQLLNKWYIKETDSDTYLQERDLYTQKRTIEEYVLNLGIIVRYNFMKSLSAYAQGSVGPMISNKATERLAKGFAFSDVFGLGLSTSICRTQFDVRYSVRHTSNLQLKSPNNGHNTTNIECIVLFKL